MRERVIATRYARALFEIALEKGAIDDVHACVTQFSKTMTAVPLFAEIVQNDEFPIEKRTRLIEGACGIFKSSDLMCRFLKLLIQRRRIGLIALIASIFDDFVAASKKITRASVTVAHETLAHDTAARMEAMLSKTLGHAAQCSARVDPALIGGMVVTIGDRRIDASVRGRLDELKESLLR